MKQEILDKEIPELKIFENDRWKVTYSAGDGKEWLTTEQLKENSERVIKEVKKDIAIFEAIEAVDRIFKKYDVEDSEQYFLTKIGKSLDDGN